MACGARGRPERTLTTVCAASGSSVNSALTRSTGPGSTGPVIRSDCATGSR
jgi:hypothetical protein